MMMNQTIGMKILTPLCRKALLQLLQSALWGQTPQSEVFASMTAQDWEQILLASRQQTVKALVCQGLTMLPEDLQPSDFLLIRWMAELGQVEKQSHQMNEALLSLITFLEGNGLRPVVLKGQGLARLYTSTSPSHVSNRRPTDIWQTEASILSISLMAVGSTPGRACPWSIIPISPTWPILMHRIACRSWNDSIPACRFP